ncbi:5113_t:CDS:2, partial [Scutellospora calospora]
NEKQLLPPQAFQELRPLQPGEDIVKAEKMPKVNRNSKKAKKKRRVPKPHPYGHIFFPQSTTELLWNQNDINNGDGLNHSSDSCEVNTWNQSINGSADSKNN